jgi:glyoxylase-like metal-dependent hydrolase (beta-lactamase superfamily II)
MSRALTSDPITEEKGAEVKGVVPLELKIEPFFDPTTFTYSYVVADLAARKAAVIDPVLDYDPASGKTSTDSADRIIDYLRRLDLTVDWILETHVHADHLTAANYLKSKVAGRIGISARVTEVQAIFGEFFNVGEDFAQNGGQFDELFNDGDSIYVGDIEITVLQTPGHTPACVTYLLEGAAFVGDTIFMPDYGTARTDFPGGDARTLYQSIRRILELPLHTKLFMCHDYGSETRTEFRFETSVAEEREHNKYVRAGIDEQTFVVAREQRDQTLSAPKLLLAAVQYNMRAGELPPAESNGVHYFKIPVRES